MVKRAPLRRIIVIGASAGGVEALRGLVQKLPEDWPAATFIAMHIGPRSKLPEILNRGSVNHVAEFARQHEPIRPGRIYIATPDYHLTLHGDHVRLAKATKEQQYKPSVNLLFQSAASEYGSRVIGVILSGLMQDGAAGMAAIKAQGGVTVVQDPQEAQFPQMPLTAMRAAPVDYCLPSLHIPALLQKLVASNHLANIQD